MPLLRYDGQEAVLTGIEAALTKQDSIVTSYRDHCQHISRGGTIEEVMAELFGRATGATKGEGEGFLPFLAIDALFQLFPCRPWGLHAHVQQEEQLLRGKWHCRGSGNTSG